MRRGRVRQWVRDLKIRNKLMLIYVIAGFVPVMIVFLLCYRQMRTLLAGQEEDSIRGYMTQAAGTLTGKLIVYDNLSDYIAYSRNLAQIAGAGYDSIYEMYEQISTQLDPMLQSLRYFHKEVLQVTIYSESCAVRHDESLAPLSVVEKEPWFERAMESAESVWYVDQAEKTAVSVRRMPLLERLGTRGLLYITVDYDSLFEGFEEIPRTDFELSILDADGTVIYSWDCLSSSQNPWIELTEEVGSEDWSIRFRQPRTVFEKALSPIADLTVLTILICVVGAALIFVFVSMYVTVRIHRLTAEMREVESGNLEPEIPQDACNDEIGQLTRGFQTMLERIRGLIQEVYGSKLAQREYEMKALQNQINPHFLYNTLSMINWKAIEAGEDDISRVTLALSTFYRTSLNKGNNVLRLRDEINNIRSYLEIQQTMHDSSFDTEIDVEESILDCESLNLILQPLAENAIEHGIDCLTDRRGKLTIRGREDNGFVVLTVEDNGNGMDAQTAEQILTRESKGYGVRNVSERIRLFYGPASEMKVESEPGRGTCIRIRFPAVPFQASKNNAYRSPFFGNNK